eukprot:CAMPEP_0115538538 /NCGR_PEP_ID=MMETSP0271-20121206/88933_1 /TAXON_ID=71861 /ORGANISM="Scrippsiella trochoidea, Strain CCMP3099" /LENGTH=311 /DNA_ID=CAMNT_0002971443 /DNA_START=176 /DNA_END=1108 /DNA_ORIENTATION=-
MRRAAILSHPVEALWWLHLHQAAILRNAALRAAQQLDQQVTTQRVILRARATQHNLQRDLGLLLARALLETAAFAADPDLAIASLSDWLQVGAAFADEKGHELEGFGFFFGEEEDEGAAPLVLSRGGLPVSLATASSLADSDGCLVSLAGNGSDASGGACAFARGRGNAWTTAAGLTSSATSLLALGARTNRAAVPQRRCLGEETACGGTASLVHRQNAGASVQEPLLTGLPWASVVSGFAWATAAGSKSPPTSSPCGNDQPIGGDGQEIPVEVSPHGAHHSSTGDAHTTRRGSHCLLGAATGAAAAAAAA